MNNIKNILGERRTYSNLANTHDHSFAQLILPLQGSLFIKTASYQLELGETRLFFLPPQCQHTFYANSQNEFLVLDIPNFMLVKETEKLCGGLSIVFDERWQAIRLLMLSEIGYVSADSHNLTNLFRYAYSILQKNYTPQSIQYINANFQESISLQKLANLEGYNPTYYCQWFKKNTGMTPKAYIQSLRLQRAKELLAHTDFSILRIAQQVGYEHHASLTRLFQQHEKVTPRIYRQQSRNLAKK
ncbi:Helix-turn-helix-domain containing protein AraC type [Hyella patelloides LEGE 07179]|uniref:Helix-turn-helix-domain containing protein AraC type n=1 Tax=Hyella patelloides LEGE 07179 TaxID=945734 RepID=A0A563VIL8_9CYAN|nr:AraC family transcriptional regulator [Hyella patelloides]VEP11229.1 Helix-turn-helix-domain containing protein AraC type [Hyella patelloides LEGE 07179]